jgi:hypothetical protein
VKAEAVRKGLQSRGFPQANKAILPDPLSAILRVDEAAIARTIEVRIDRVSWPIPPQAPVIGCPATRRSNLLEAL